MVDEEILPGNFQDATSQLLNMKQKGADYAYINVTTTGVSLVLSDAKKLGLDDQVRLEPLRLLRAAAGRGRDAAEGVTGVVPHVAVRRRTSRAWRTLVDYPREEPPERHARRACTCAAGPT